MDIKTFVDEAKGSIHLAVSGGVDSMALMHAVFSCNTAKKIIVHNVLHHIENDSEKVLSKKIFASEMIKRDILLSNSNASFILHNVVIKGANVEAKARKLRYDAIFSKMNDGDTLFVAHHKGDLVENVIMNVVKGRGLNGLTSLRESNLVSLEDKKVNICRPFLLNYTKENLTLYLKNIQKNYIFDESNNSNSYDRNFIRNLVIPLLSKRFCVLTNSIISCFSSLLSSKYVLDELIEEKVVSISTFDNGFNLKLFNNFSYNLKKEILIYILRKNGIFQYRKKMMGEIIKQFQNAEKNYSMCSGISFKSGDKYATVRYGKKDKVLSFFIKSETL